MFFLGSAYPTGKLALNDTIPPILFGALRMGIVFVCLIPFCKFYVPEKKYILPLIGFSLCFGVAVNFFLYFSIHVSSILAPITIGAQLSIPFGIILSSIFLKESISYNKWFFVISAFIGIIIVGFDPKIVNNIFALFLTGLMAFFYGIANVVSRQIKSIRVVTQTSIMSLIGLVILFLLSYYFEGHMIDNIKNIRFDVWLLILHASLIVSVIAHMSLFYLYKFYTIGTVFPYYSLFPIFGIIQTLITFQEIPTLITIFGGIIVISSVFMLQKTR